MIALTALVACAGDSVVVPESGEVFVSVVIAPDGAAPSRVALHGFLLRAGTPLRSPYLVASRFEMRRVSDGALFDWRPVVPPDSIVGGGSQHVLYADGNYVLPEAGSGGRLGREDIRTGETYALTVEVEGHSVTGTVTVPGVPLIDRSGGAGNTGSIVWHSAPGAQGYSIVTTDFFPLSDFTIDTTYRFDSPTPPNTSTKGTVVRAYEGQLFSYLTDRRLGRSGLQGGLGVFGAYNSDSLPPRAAGAPGR